MRRTRSAPVRPATVTISVVPVNDDPVAVDDSDSVSEDAAPVQIDVLANDGDDDAGDVLTVAAVDTTGTKGLVTNNGTDVTYDPNGQFDALEDGQTDTDTFAYTVSDGHGGTDSATVTVTVTGVSTDVAPTAVADSATVGEDSGASAVDVLANDTDPDGGPMTISSASDPTDGTVVLTGGVPGAHTGLTYEPDPNYCNDPPGTTTDEFSYTLNGGSTTTVSMTVTCVDDPPTAVADSAAVLEDATATAVPVLTNDTDIDGGPQTIASASDPAHGTVVVTVDGSGLTYQPDADYCNDPPGTTADPFTYTLDGGSTATVSMTVTCTPDSPIVDTSAGSTTFTENAAATVIDAAVTVTDPDAGTTIIRATVRITGNYAGTEDVLALAGSHPDITSAFVGDTLTLTGNASPAAYESALRDVTYRNTSDNPLTAPRTVTFRVTDSTSQSASDTKVITVVAVN